MDTLLRSHLNRSCCVRKIRGATCHDKHHVQHETISCVVFVGQRGPLPPQSTCGLVFFEAGKAHRCESFYRFRVHAFLLLFSFNGALHRFCSGKGRLHAHYCVAQTICRRLNILPLCVGHSTVRSIHVCTAHTHAVIVVFFIFSSYQPVLQKPLKIYSKLFEHDLTQ